MLHTCKEIKICPAEFFFSSVDVIFECVDYKGTFSSTLHKMYLRRKI